MNEPLVSLVIPAYNASDTLPIAVSSMLRQTYDPIEIIVVDDGSDDNTAEVATQLSPDVRVVRQSNCGLPIARNVGARAAKGEYIAFLDADDGSHPLRIERQMAALRADADVGCVVTGRVRVSPDSVQTRKVDTCQSLTHHSVTDLLAMCQRGVGASMLIRRHIFEAVEGYFEVQPKRPSGEDELLTRVATHGGVATIGQPLYWVFASEDSMRWDYTPETFAETHARWLAPWVTGDTDAQPGIIDTPTTRKAARAGLLRRCIWRAWAVRDATHVDSALKHLGEWGALRLSERLMATSAKALIAIAGNRQTS